MLTNEPNYIWKSWEKILFRFSFLFLGFFLLNYELAMVSLYFNFYNSLRKFYALFSTPLQWLDQHLYHLGYQPKVHDSMPGDNHFGAAYYLTVLILIVITVIVWSIVQWDKAAYNKLYYWFRLYVRCMVALIMFGYGMDKLIPSQMPYPDVEQLLTKIGAQNHFNAVWTFIGSSPAYEMFTGLCEVTGSLLLLFRRTHIFGCLFMCTILCNVVALNIFYNIPVKMYSALLLVCVIFLLIPYLNKLFRFFFLGKNETLLEKQYVFQRSWKGKLVIAISVIIPILSFIHDTYREYRSYRKYHIDIKDEKLFEVTTFILKDTIAPLVTDTIRWRRFALPNKNTAVIYNMQDNPDEYEFDIDTLQHNYTLHNNADTAKWDVLHYQHPDKHILEFLGKWKGKDVHIFMKELPLDSMTLNKDKMAFLQD